MIYIECNADETLLRVLGFSRSQFVHQSGKYEICKRLQKSKDSIGLIEHDGGQSDPIYRNECTLTEQRHNIKTYLHRASGNQLIILYNDLEDWTIEVARTNGVSVEDFGLDRNRERMHRLMPYRLPNYQRLISELLGQKFQEILYLQAKLRGR